MRTEKNRVLKITVKILSLTLLAQGLIACGGDGVFSNQRTFANKNLDGIEVTETEESVLGLNSEDIESGEEVTAIQGDGEDYSTNNDEEDSNEPVENGSNEESTADDNTVAENCPGKSKCNGKKFLADEYSPGEDDASDTDDSSTMSGSNYICILDGPGKSIRLGLVDDVASGQVGTPDVVCMSKVACLGEISKVFDVKMAHKRGFCPNKNPHVIQMSDEEIALMVGKLQE